MSQIKLNSDAISHHGLEARHLQVRVGGLNRVRSGAKHLFPSTPNFFEGMNLEQLRPLLHGEVGYPIELVEIVLGESEDEAKPNPGPTNRVQVTCHHRESLIRGPHPIMGGRDAVETDGEQVEHVP